MDRKFRFYLKRIWDENKSFVMFIGLNPSTANETENDPTIKRCINFAKAWGYGGMFMTNLFAFVSTDPKKLMFDRIAENDHWIYEISKNIDKIVFVWGAFKIHKSRMDEVIKTFPTAYCIGKTKDGYPRHPLYLRSDSKPVIYLTPLTPGLYKCKQDFEKAASMLKHKKGYILNVIEVHDTHAVCQMLKPKDVVQFHMSTEDIFKNYVKNNS